MTSYSERWTILTGAGTSIAPLLSIPGWGALISDLIDAVGDRAALCSSAASDARERIKLSIGRDVPYELVGGTMEEALGPRYREAFGWMMDRPPNDTHRGMARLADAGKVRAIFTTNFDCCIEAAFAERGIPTVVTQCEDFASISSIAETGVVPVVKLHGQPTAQGHFADDVF